MSTSAEVLNRSTVNNAGGRIETIVNNTITGHPSDAMRTLWERVAPNARLNSKAVADALSYGPMTRIVIKSDIKSRIMDESVNIQWITGPPGFGKSSLVKAVADELKGEGPAVNFACFFFSPNDLQRNNLDRFVPTLAYDLALSNKDVKDSIIQAIVHDASMLDSSGALEVQWRKLVVEPLEAVSRDVASPCVILIDGLDHCGDEDRRKVLNLVASSIPLKFLIASRPEPFIVNNFRMQPLASCSRLVVDLADNQHPEEVREYVKTHFSELYKRRQDILRAYAQEGHWPLEDIVEHIVSKADGQYIYISSLFEYLDDDNANPQERLQAFLEQAPEALFPLTSLYTRILESSHRPGDVRLQNILSLICQGHRPTVGTLTSRFYADSGQCRHALRKLHSVLKISLDDDNEPIFARHQSFVDFLLDARRSGEYHVGGEIYTRRWINKLKDIVKHLAMSCHFLMPLSFAYVCDLVASCFPMFM
ncbi:hypothetical protein AX16_001656 [Volvariella volvacea WC 439]|nr:hypothetical protein AX16_001656 [Volvariella volvacea WC 439]